MPELVTLVNGDRHEIKVAPSQVDEYNAQGFYTWEEWKIQAAAAEKVEDKKIEEKDKQG